MPAAPPAYSLDTLSGEAAAPPYAGNAPAQVARAAAVRLAAVAPPGPWTSDRYAQVNHYTGLVYCAAKAKRDALVAATVTATKLRPRKHLKAVSSPRPHTHDEDRVPVPEGHPLAELFADPNDQDTVGDLLGDLVVQQDLHGIALLWHPLNSAGRPARLHVLPASAVQYIPPSGLYPQGGYTVTFAGTYTPLAVPGAGWSVSLDKREVLEIRDRHPRVWYGTWGPLDAGAEWVDLARGIDISQKRAFDHGFSPDVVLSIDGATSDVIDAVEAQIKARYEGRDGRKVLVADGTGVKAEKLNTTPREMDFAASKDMATKQVLALFGVNSTVAGLTDADSYASLYAKLRQFYGGTMANLCQRWSAAFTKHIARKFYGAGYAVEVTVPTPDDPDRLDKQRDAAMSAGAITVNEYRGQLDLDPWPDGDVPGFEFQAKRQQAFAPPPPAAVPGADPAVAPPGAPAPDNPAGEGSLPNRLKAMSVEYSDPAPYGYCPECRTPGVLAERRPNGDAQCGNGHRYPLAKAKYASTQIDLTGPAAERLRALAAAIPDADLADDGRETDPHVTVRYGLHADAPGPVAAAVAGFGSVQLHLNGLSAFRGKEYDVIYATVNSPDLLRLHAALAALPHTDTHRTYVPHATVAYVKPGLADKYLASLGWVDVAARVSRLTFSTAGREHTDIPLIARKAMSAYCDGAGGELVPPAVARRRVKLKRAKRFAARVVESLGGGRYAKAADAHGHEHRGRGPGGGQFVAAGGGGDVGQAVRAHLTTAGTHPAKAVAADVAAAVGHDRAAVDKALMDLYRGGWKPGDSHPDDATRSPVPAGVVHAASWGDARQNVVDLVNDLKGVFRQARTDPAAARETARETFSTAADAVHEMYAGKPEKDLGRALRRLREIRVSVELALAEADRGRGAVLDPRTLAGDVKWTVILREARALAAAHKRAFAARVVKSLGLTEATHAG